MRRGGAGLTAVTLVFGWAGAAPPLNAHDRLAMAVLPSRPDRVSGGNALVEVNLPSTDRHRDDAGDIHHRFRDFSVRERLRKANGRTDNRRSGSIRMTPPAWARRWRASPSGQGLDTQTGARIDEAATFDGPGRCHPLVPNHKNPRLVAAAPIADDIATCQLKPIDSRDYEVALTPKQVQMPKTISPPSGCDYSKPGQNQLPIAGTYLKLPLPTRTPATTTARSEQ